MHPKRPSQARGAMGGSTRPTHCAPSSLVTHNPTAGFKKYDSPLSAFSTIHPVSDPVITSVIVTVLASFKVIRFPGSIQLGSMTLGSIAFPRASSFF
jgi:hypothetical protein